MTRVNMAALRGALSKYIELAKKGEEIVVTSRGKDAVKISTLVTESQPPAIRDCAKFLRELKPIRFPHKARSSTELIREERDSDIG